MADSLEIEIRDMIERKVNNFKHDLFNMLTVERGLTSSSKAVESLTIVMNESEKYVGLEAVDYIYYVIHGRGPGKFPPPNNQGKWPLPFPAAKKIAEEGNLQKYKTFADKFDEMYNELIIDVQKESEKVASDFMIRITSFKNKQIWQKQ